MLDRLRSAFADAVRNFHEELNRDGSEVGLSLEAAERARLVELERSIAEATREAESEAELEATCIRRASLADQVGDPETARIALEFAVHHRTRVELLREKISILGRELAHRRESPAADPGVP
jgi:hypothetical protein